MAYLIGRGRYQRAVYPTSTGVGSGGIELSIYSGLVNGDAPIVDLNADLRNFVPKNDALDPMEVSFDDWIDGSVLEVDFSISFATSLTAGMVLVVVPVVSFDNWATNSQIEGGAASAYAQDATVPIYGQAAQTTAVPVPGIIAPRIRLLTLASAAAPFEPGDTWQLDADAYCANLKCTRLSPALARNPAGVFV